MEAGEGKRPLGAMTIVTYYGGSTLKLRRNRGLGLLVGLAVVICLPGCGGDGRRAVSGTVTVDGEPLASGVISFQPTADNPAHSAGTGIEAGRYQISASSGLMPGEYQVRIQAFRQTGRMVEDPQFGQVEETVPVVFKEAGSLRATVSASGRNEIDFDLHSVPGP